MLPVSPCFFYPQWCSLYYSFYSPVSHTHFYRIVLLVYYILLRIEYGFMRAAYHYILFSFGFLNDIPTFSKLGCLFSSSPPAFHHLLHLKKPQISFIFGISLWSLNPSVMSYNFLLFAGVLLLSFKAISGLF